MKNLKQIEKILITIISIITCIIIGCFIYLSFNDISTKFCIILSKFIQINYKLLYLISQIIIVWICIIFVFLDIKIIKIMQNIYHKKNDNKI